MRGAATEMHTNPREADSGMEICMCRKSGGRAPGKSWRRNRTGHVGRGPDKASAHPKGSREKPP